MRRRGLVPRVQALAVAMALSVAAGAGCASRSTPAPLRAPLSTREWGDVVARTAALRAAAAARPASQTVRVTMHDPRTRRAFDARGAIAVLPGQAMRMILLGPGGATALDVWVTRDRYRLVVPALDLVRRGAGGAAEPPPPPPIGFLRWWFLAPFDGRPRAAVREDPGIAVVLRDAEGASVVLRESPGLLTLRRTLGSSREEVRIEGEPFAVGARVGYVDQTLGVRVDVVVEAVSREPVDPEAFADPDGGSAAAETAPAAPVSAGAASAAAAKVTAQPR